MFRLPVGPEEGHLGHMTSRVWGVFWQCVFQAASQLAGYLRHERHMTGTYQAQGLEIIGYIIRATASPEHQYRPLLGTNTCQGAELGA